MGNVGGESEEEELHDGPEEYPNLQTRVVCRNSFITGHTGRDAGSRYV